MEFHLLPIHRGDPPIPVPRTPFVSRERYDGGPWLSYSARKGRAAHALDGTPFDSLSHQRAEHINPTPVDEQESFFQTWLYFGLIAEFTGVNAVDEAFFDPDKRQGIDHIYNTILVSDSDQSYVKLDQETLGTLLVLGRAKLPPDLEGKKKYYCHLQLCLSYVHAMISMVPKEFNHAIRCSILALGELFTVSTNFALEALQVPLSFGRTWSASFLSDEMKESMKHHGWCPSDIARAEAKYQSIQLLYIARMLDKKLPYRSHKDCTEWVCKSYQINMGEYQALHQKLQNPVCPCRELAVSEHDTTKILLRDDQSYPLLRFKGDLFDLAYEIVDSSLNIPYVAISHVWADGLGNPSANSLPRCKLHHLRSLVDALSKKEASNEQQAAEGPLIWLDTLCCPAINGEGKINAIEKIRLVYRKAKHVLVLDAGLMSYPWKGMDASEALARIFTSSWMRRLWTLQEGALAQSLYFQYADEAVSMNQVTRSVVAMTRSMPHRALFSDIRNEFMSLNGFFHSPTPMLLGSSLNILDRALQYRSVSVASDEPLCIGTLMNLDLSAILAVRSHTDLVQKVWELISAKHGGNAARIILRKIAALNTEELQEKRMQKVWQLISTKHGGIPSQIIFFEDPKLSGKGWRWASKSLLTSQGPYVMNTRMLRWLDTQLGQQTPRGLRVQYPGYRMSLKDDYGDGKPRYPWPGRPRVPESWLQFRDIKTGKWCRIVDNKYAVLSKSWTTEEQRREYNDLELFPLHDVADTGQAFLLLGKGEDMREGILATAEEEPTKDGIAVRIERHVMVQDLGEEGYIYDVIEKLALRLRGEEMTDTHLRLYERVRGDLEDSSATAKQLAIENDELEASIKRLKDKMIEFLAEVVHEDTKFAEMVKNYWGNRFLENLWVLISDWFRQDIFGEKLEDEQVWFVD
jgi:hypothetical protein